LSLSQQEVSHLFAGVNLGRDFPEVIEFQSERLGKLSLHLRYSFEPGLQRDMERFFKLYHPDYGAFVAADPQTGRVLSLVSFADEPMVGNLALRATFPSASVFKVVTAAAAIETQHVSADTLIAFHGKSHTLYRGQVMNSHRNRWTRFVTLKDAFAKSVNAAFAKMGVFTVGADGLRLYADRFGFNRKIEGDLPVQEGRALVPGDFWGLAETASGFTRENTMSPLQGALMAASVVNGGVMMKPYVVESVSTIENRLYQVEPQVSGVPIAPETALVMRDLMQETVLTGTSKKSFRGFFKKSLMELEVGGKTGSLTGNQPPGKYDWFIGYADSGTKKIAFAVLTIHKKQWRVKSAYLARLAIESYFKGSRNAVVARR